MFIFKPFIKLNEFLAKLIGSIFTGTLGLLVHFILAGIVFGSLTGLIFWVFYQSYLFFLPEQAGMVMETALENGDFQTIIDDFKILIVLYVLTYGIITILPILSTVLASKIYKEKREERLHKKYSRNTFGNARFAETKELLNLGLQGNGIVFGRKDRKLIEKPSHMEGHTLVVGGTGTGKSRGIAIPTLLRWRGSAIVIDIKGELSRITANSRNGRVFIFNPEQEGHGYNPLTQIKRVDDAQELARYLIPEPPNVSDPFWFKCAQGILAAVAFESAKNHHTLAQMAERICLTPMEELILELQNSQFKQVQLLSAVANGMPEKTLGGVMAELRSKLLTLASDESIERATNKSDFSPETLEEGATIYISVSEHMLGQYKELFALIIGQFLRYLSKREENTEPAVLMCLDELPRLGKFPGLIDSLATLRSRNVHILAIIQSMAQLDTIYGKDERKVIADNCRFKYVLSATDPETQKYFSDLAGQRTALAKGITHGKEWIPNVSRNEQGVPLVRPEEWASLKQPILFVPKLQPSPLELAFWDQDKDLKHLVKINQIS